MVKKVILNLDSSKASGPDCIPVVVLKNCEPDKHLLTNTFRSSKLHKTFNSNTVKVSYSCAPNFQQIIKRHNKKLTSRNQKQLTVTVEENKNALCKANVVQKVLFTNVWQNLITFHQKHTSANQRAIGKHVTTTTLSLLET